MAEVRDVLQDKFHVPNIEKSYSKIPEVAGLPRLVQIQLDSYDWFTREGLPELLNEISPIEDFTGTRLELAFSDHEFGDPKYLEAECRLRDATYAAPLKVSARLLIRETGEIKEQEIFIGDFPIMTPRGTFIINGAERVVVSQLVRSPGVYFTLERDPTSGRDLCYTKLIPNRGAWLEFETSNKDIISVKVDRRRKIPVTTFLSAIDADSEIQDDRLLGTKDRLLGMFDDVDANPEHRYLQSTIERDSAITNKEEAILEFYRRIRPGDPPTLDNAHSLMTALFFNSRRYDQGKVGRYKVNRRLGLDIPDDHRTLTREDIVAIVREIVRLNNGVGSPDDIDHLGNRRVRTVGELIQNQFRIGLLRMERVIRERMTITDPDTTTPSTLINIRPVVAAIKEFFGGSQLSQFMDQTNPLAELTHKRRLSALGPGGLSRDRAGFDVRDVHHSHYGRICPIETPEGPNIGLIGSLATYGRVNDYGFIETPYRKVLRQVPSNSRRLVGRVLCQEVKDSKGKQVAAADTEVAADLAKRLIRLSVQELKVRTFVSEEVVYLSADEEENFVVAQANSPLDDRGHFLEERPEARSSGSFIAALPEQIDYLDLSPKQTVSVAAALIPFLEHDDANRALMGANMQRQAAPLVRPQLPIVRTGMERHTAIDSGQVLLAEGDGIVTSVSGQEIKIRYGKSKTKGEEKTYPLVKFIRSNQGTCITQRAIVSGGDRVAKDQPLADSSSTDGGQLALGQTLLGAFMSWEGYNFEDAIIISEDVARQDKFTSIHMEKHEIEARDTKLGPEEITCDIPNVGEESLRDLDETGIIRIGAEVHAGDILVGKITPKGETELTAEEKLLRAIFGEKAREVKDTSLRVPHGERGKVIDVKIFSRDKHDELPAGVNTMVRVSVAQQRKIAEGDKMAGRHGNKGVIARILPVEDMPHLEDGTPVDIILNPIGVPSRMNIGQVLETHLGWAAHNLGFAAVTPVFDGSNPQLIEDALCRSWICQRADALRSSGNGTSDEVGENVDSEKASNWLKQQGYDPCKVFDDNQVGEAKRAALEVFLEEQGEKRVRGKAEEKLEKLAEKHLAQGVAAPIFGKQTLMDGRTGESFDQPVTVGYIYMMKLVHLVEDKIHARSTGPYSLITQQPLGGKAQFGGQRFGEMEVWALEAYGAAHVLQELLTVKSDDVVGRVKTYEAIVKGEDIHEPGVPESFKVLVKELQSLGLAVEVLNEEEERVTLADTSTAELPELGIDLSGFEKGEDILGS